MAGYWEIPEKCRSCANSRNRNEGMPLKSDYRCCHVLYSGKKITADIKCPKDIENKRYINLGELIKMEI